MTVKKISEIPSEKIEWGIHRIIEKTDNILIKITEMPPGKEHSSHIHDMNEIIYVIEGGGIHYEENRKYTISKGDIIIVPKGTPHSTSNTSNKILKLLVIFYK